MEYIFDDVLEIKNGKNQKAVENPDGQYPIYGSGGVMGYADEYICDADTVIIGRKGSINNPIYVAEPFWNVDTAFGLSAKKEYLLPKYLFYFCKKFDFEKLNKTVTIPSLTKSDLLKIKIDLPDKEEQQTIIDKLSKIESIITHRKQELTVLDDLIKARFVELFGDPVSDTKEWGQKPLQEMLESIRYGTSTPPEVSESGYAFIRATNIKNGRIVDNDMKYIPQEEAERLAKCKLFGGEILIVRSGVNAGDTCVVTKEYIGQYAGYDMILVLNKKLNSVFFNVLVNTSYMDKVVKPLTRRAAQPHLNSEQVQSFPIIQVPIELQNEFADFVHQVDKSKVAVQKALDETQLLFDSLMQEYFG